MNAAIDCACGDLIVYNSTRITSIQCPTCKRWWYSQPSMFSDDGLEALKRPYLGAAFVGREWNDETIAEYVDQLKRVPEKWSRFAAMPPPSYNNVTFVFSSGINQTHSMATVAIKQ